MSLLERTMEFQYYLNRLNEGKELLKKLRENDHYISSDPSEFWKTIYPIYQEEVLKQSCIRKRMMRENDLSPVQAELLMNMRKNIL